MVSDIRVFFLACCSGPPLFDVSAGRSGLGRVCLWAASDEVDGCRECSGHCFVAGEFASVVEGDGLYPGNGHLFERVDDGLGDQVRMFRVHVAAREQT